MFFLISPSLSFQLRHPPADGGPVDGGAAAQAQPAAMRRQVRQQPRRRRCPPDWPADWCPGRNPAHRGRHPDLPPRLLRAGAARSGRLLAGLLQQSHQ